jgi:uncharacterized protein (DUF433 family)
MSVIDQARNLIRQMNRHEKAQLLSIVAADPEVQFPGIAVTPGVCGGSPRIAGTRIPVWLLAALRRDGMSDEKLLEAYPQLSAEQLKHVWKFVQQNPELVEEEIADNEAE